MFTLLVFIGILILLGAGHFIWRLFEVGAILIITAILVIVAMFFWVISANAADYREPAPHHAYIEPMEPEDMPIAPPPMAFRPAGSPPGIVFYAPHPVAAGACLPGFFWRVYPDGNGECWPWQ